MKELDIEIKEIKQKFSSAVANQKKLELHRNNIAKTLKSDEERIEEYKTEIRSQEQKCVFCTAYKLTFYKSFCYCMVKIQPYHLTDQLN